MTDFQHFIDQYPLLFENSGIDKSWEPLLASVFTTQEPRLKSIARILSYVPDWFPKSDKLWSFTKFCRPEDVKVIIVGQDPSDDATGLAFSKAIGAGIYPSTETILEEVSSDIGDTLRPFPENYGNLEYWAEQGVLLLNSALTKTKYKSHLDLGWKNIVIELIKQLQNMNRNIVFMFWGEHAKSLRYHVEKRFEDDYWNQYSAGHPSSNNKLNNFLGCKHFSQANRWLVAHGMIPIDWCPVPPKNDS